MVAIIGKTPARLAPKQFHPGHVCLFLRHKISRNSSREGYNALVGVTNGTFCEAVFSADREHKRAALPGSLAGTRMRQCLLGRAVARTVLLRHGMSQKLHHLTQSSSMLMISTRTSRFGTRAVQKTSWKFSRMQRRSTLTFHHGIRVELRRWYSPFSTPFRSIKIFLPGTCRRS